MDQQVAAQMHRIFELGDWPGPAQAQRRSQAKHSGHRQGDSQRQPGQRQQLGCVGHTHGTGRAASTTMRIRSEAEGSAGWRTAADGCVHGVSNNSAEYNQAVRKPAQNAATRRTDCCTFAGGVRVLSYRTAPVPMPRTRYAPIPPPPRSLRRRVSRALPACPPWPKRPATTRSHCAPKSAAKWPMTVCTSRSTAKHSTATPPSSRRRRPRALNQALQTARQNKDVIVSQGSRNSLSGLRRQGSADHRLARACRAAPESGDFASLSKLTAELMKSLKMGGMYFSVSDLIRKQNEDALLAMP